jgi:RHS repeat-associated protein
VVGGESPAWLRLADETPVWLRASVTGDGAQTDTWDNATSDLPLLLTDGTDDYLYGPNDQAIEQVDQTSGTTTYLQHDQIGSVRTLTDQTGAIVGTYSYYPYGVLLAHDGGESTPFGYTGQYTDRSGLIYLRARYYDPATAQFISVDPMLDQTRGWYAYAGADPLDATDPSRLHLCDVDAGGSCTTGGSDTAGTTGLIAAPTSIGGGTDSGSVSSGAEPSPMPHPGDPAGAAGPTLPCGLSGGATELDSTLSRLNSLYGSTAAGAGAARQSVSDAARLLSRSPDPAVRSAAGKVLAKLGRPTRDLIADPVIEHAAKVSVVASFFLNIAEYSTEYSSPVEIVSRAALATASGFVGALVGGVVGGVVCPLLGVPDAGIATVFCEGSLALAGAYAGDQAGAKLSDLVADVVWNSDGLPASTGNVLLVFPKAEPGPSPSPPKERK